MNYFVFLFALVSLVGCASSSVDETQGVCAERIKSEGVSAALEVCKRQADAGDVSANYLLARVYMAGVGVEKNKTLAFRYLNQAAVGGNSDAQYRMAKSFDPTEGNPENSKNALFWLRKSAAQNNREAQNAIYQEFDHNPHSLTQDEALTMLKRAAENGFGPAESELGRLYFIGELVAQDTPHALTYFESAFRHGHCLSGYYLASFYAWGEGVAKDPGKGLEFLKGAARMGCALAQQEIAINPVVINRPEEVMFMSNKANGATTNGTFSGILTKISNKTSPAGNSLLILSVQGPIQSQPNCSSSKNQFVLQITPKTANTISTAKLALGSHIPVKITGAGRCTQVDGIEDLLWLFPQDPAIHVVP